MRVAVKVKNVDKLTRKLRRLPEAQRAPVKRAVTLSCVDVHRAAVSSIQRGSKTGAVRMRYLGGAKVKHQASAPGEAPATDTGALAASVHWALWASGLGGSVGTNLEYGKHLEHGTSRIEPRPWLFPAAERNRRKIVERLKTAVREALKGSE